MQVFIHVSAREHNEVSWVKPILRFYKVDELVNRLYKLIEAGSIAEYTNWGVPARQPAKGLATIRTRKCVAWLALLLIILSVQAVEH